MELYHFPVMDSIGLARPMACQSDTNLVQVKKAKPKQIRRTRSEPNLHDFLSIDIDPHFKELRAHPNAIQPAVDEAPMPSVISDLLDLCSGNPNLMTGKETVSIKFSKSKPRQSVVAIYESTRASPIPAPLFSFTQSVVKSKIPIESLLGELRGTTNTVRSGQNNAKLGRIRRNTIDDGLDSKQRTNSTYMGIY